jgi:hypothetical protein
MAKFIWLFICVLFFVIPGIVGLQAQERPEPPDRPEGFDRPEPGDRPEHNQDIQQIKEKIMHLREMAKAAKEGDDMEEARELMEKAMELEKQLKERFQPRERRDQRGSDVRQKIMQIREMIKAAKESGDMDKARELAEKAAAIEREFRERMQPGDRKEPESDQKMEKIRAFLKEFYPEKLEELERLREENPAAFAREIQGCVREIQNLENLKKNDPERFKEVIELRKLERESMRIAESYRRERDTNKKVEIKQKLREILNCIFEHKNKEQQREIEHLSQELDRLKKRIESRTQNKDKILDRRINEMTGEKDESDW